MPDESVLSVNDLRTWFELKKFGLIHAGYCKALDGVSFDLKEGEAVTIVGESGSGKTTLLRTILGLARLTGGELSFSDRSITNQNTKDLQWLQSQVGFVQQDPYGALPPFMTIERILKEPMLVNKVDKREHDVRIRRVLEEVRLMPVDDYLSKYPHMLSGGQQQRLVIARAIILNPKLVVADEPVSMLDASMRVEILELIRKIQKSHKIGVIFITHDLSSVRYFSQRVFVMYAARLVEKTSVDEVVRNPLHPYTRTLLNAIPDPDPDNVTRFKEVLPGEPPSLIHPPDGCRFHPRCPAVIKGLCDVELPREFEPEPGHLVECWLYKDR